MRRETPRPARNRMNCIGGPAGDLPVAPTDAAWFPLKAVRERKELAGTPRKCGIARKPTVSSVSHSQRTAGRTAPVSCNRSKADGFTAKRILSLFHPAQDGVGRSPARQSRSRAHNPMVGAEVLRTPGPGAGDFIGRVRRCIRGLPPELRGLPIGENGRGRIWPGAQIPQPSPERGPRCRTPAPGPESGRDARP
jgi:hypothetical protein